MYFSRVLKVLAKKWYIIALLMLVSIAIALCSSYFFAENYYVSEGKLFISPVIEPNVKPDDISVDVNTIINSIIDVGKSDAVLSDVANDQALQVLGYSVKELQSLVSLSKTSSGLVIICNTNTPMHSQIIVSAYLNSGVPRIQSIIAKDGKNTFNYTIVSEPKEGEKAKEVIISTAIIAAIVGGLIGVFMIALPYIAGKKENDPDYIAEDFDTKILGKLPKEFI